MQTERYEALILTIPEITNDESGEIEKLLDKKIQQFKGKLLSYDRWGKYQLEYDIKHNEYGVYFLTRFDVPQDKRDEILKEIKTLFDLKFNEVIMRYLVSHLDAETPLDYKRPQSLEETPKDVDQFLRENRMSGIAPRRAPRPEPREVRAEASKKEAPQDNAIKEKSTEAGKE